MERRFYLDLAASGMGMPIGTDLVLNEHSDHADILRDGRRLGELMAEAAMRYRTPLAFPVMDLELEKLHLLDVLEIETDDPSTFHFSTAPGKEAVERLGEWLDQPLSERMQAICGALSYLSQSTTLVPVGMCIGPFSLMTKLVTDPITPIAMAGMGMTAADEPGIDTVEQALEMAALAILRYIEAQIVAGAKAIFICEPAANRVYLSPNQIERGSDIFERFVIANLQRIRHLLLEHDVDLFFHDCGELTDYMVQQFALLDPALLSLGSSRDLVHDVTLVPRDIVLFGNLPSKRFYSDAEISVGQVRAMASELVARMRETGHPFILGSECDVLCVPGCERELAAKAMAIVECRDAVAGATEASVVDYAAAT